MTYYRIEPLDCLFFRDGSPYNLGESNQTDVASMFPPNPATVIGALRAGMARTLGWTGQGEWGPDIIAKVGDGDDLGPLDFNGPFIGFDKDLLFPFPRHVIGKVRIPKEGGEDKLECKNLVVLKPDKPISSDVGETRFPVSGMALEKQKNIDAYLRGGDLSRILWNDNIQEIDAIPAGAVFKEEISVGIKRDPMKMTVGEGGLFSRRFIRMSEKAHLIIGCDGFEEEVGRFVMLGGESKGAFIERMDTTPNLPDVPTEIGKLNRFLVYFATPANLGPIEIGKQLPDLCNARLVSGCMDRPVMIGGWDFRKGPLELTPHIPAGSVFFMESDEEIDAGKLNNTKIGKQTKFGFGHILIGKW